MLSALVVWLTLAGGPGADPPLPPDIWEFSRRHLEWVKDRRAGLEGTIRMYEEYLKEPGFFTPAQAARFRRQSDDLRETVRDMKEMERELERWERERKVNPGLRTDLEAVDRLTELTERQDARRRGLIAPMPREKK